MKLTGRLCQRWLGGEVIWAGAPRVVLQMPRMAAGAIDLPKWVARMANRDAARSEADVQLGDGSEADCFQLLGIEPMTPKERDPWTRPTTRTAAVSP